VPGDDRLLLAERVDKAENIADQVQQRVLVDRLGTVGPAITAHVGRHGVKSSRRQGGELMAPGVPALGKAVTQHDQRTLALLRQVHMNSVCLDGSMPDLAWCHIPLPYSVAEPYRSAGSRISPATRTRTRKALPGR
jgi:hypothetical protein